MGFGDNALNLDVLVWSNDPAGQALLQSDLYYRIEAHLRRAGIDIPFPQRTLHVAADELGAAMAQFSAGRGPHAVELYDARGAPALVDIGGVDPSSTAGRRRADRRRAGAHARRRPPDRAHARVRAGSPSRDRRHLLAVYEKCFVGTEGGRMADARPGPHPRRGRPARAITRRARRF
jgi:hypothetical protein